MAAILDSAIFYKNKLHSFILTQLDDGSDIEFCHFGFSHFAQKKTFTHSFWLNLNMAAILNSASILNSAILDSAILHKKTFTHSFWLDLMMAAILNSASILNSAILDSAILHKKLHLFILTQFDDDSHLELCHVGFKHCHLGFRHLVIFSQIHSKTLLFC